MAFPENTTVIDDFNRADGALGANWKAPFEAGMFAPLIISNRIGEAAFQWTDALYIAATFGPDVDFYWEVPVAESARTYYHYFRVVDQGATVDGYAVYPQAAGSKLFRVDAGSMTQLGADFSMTIANNDKIGMRAAGSTIEAYHYTGGGWSLKRTATDATYGAAGYVGIVGQWNVRRYDNLSGGTVAPATPLRYTYGSVNAPNRLGVADGVNRLGIADAVNRLGKVETS